MPKCVHVLLRLTMMDRGTRPSNARLADHDRWGCAAVSRAALANASGSGELGGSASISEIVETVIKREVFSDAQQAMLHNDGPETEIGYRLAWARTYLKAMDLLTNSSQGVWALIDDGTASAGQGPSEMPSALPHHRQSIGSSTGQTYRSIRR